MSVREDNELYLHPYICEQCMGEIPLTTAQYEKAVDERGRLYCETCLERKLNPKPRRRRTNGNDWRDQIGCIVTWRGPNGDQHVVCEQGSIKVALKRITNGIPPGGVVLSISTPRTILRDLTHTPRRYGGHGPKEARIDPYSVERQLLGKIGRLDLLPEEARS